MSSPVIPPPQGFGSGDGESIESEINDLLPDEVQTSYTGVFLDDSGEAIKDTLNHVEDLMLHTGIRKGLTLTVNADDTKFDIAAGEAIIVDRDPDPTNSTVTRINFSETLAITDPNLTEALSHVYMNSAGTISVETDPPTLSDVNDRIYLGSLLHISSVIDSAVPNPIIAHGTSITEMIALVLGGGSTLLGALVTANGANLSLDVAAGLLQQYGRGFNVDANRPNEAETPVQAAIPSGNFFKAYINGSGDLVQENGTNLLDPTQFNEDGLGTLETVANNQFTIVRVFYAGITNDVILYFGTEEFSTITAARAAPELTWIEHPGTRDISPIAKIIIREDVTDLASAIAGGTAEIQEIKSRIEL